MKAIEVSNLTKKFKEKTAVDHISFDVNEGEIFALLGVNGAGKTTTIRMLSAISNITDGNAKVMGFDVETDPKEVKKVIAISPQETSVSELLTVEENLKFIGSVFFEDKQKVQERCREMIEMFKLEEVLHQRAKTLSGGWQRKLSIAMALISQPKVLFLDEPTLGLDVLARRELWNSIEKIRGKITIILTTHYMEEVEALSDRVAIMVKGKIKEIGTLTELEERTGEKGLENVFVKIATAEGGNE